MIKAVEFYKEIRAGSSLPLIVGGSDGNKYVLKLRGSGDGVIANIVEWLSLRLGRLAQIPVLEPVLLSVDAGFAKKAQDPEIREVLKKSAGINFGTKYVEPASMYNERSAYAIDNVTKDNIFLYDLFLLNLDRNSENSNMIFNHLGLWSLDYSSAMTMRSCIDGKNYENLAILGEIKRHPFYRDNIHAHDFIRKFGEIEDSRLRDIVDELPEEWICHLNVADESRETKRIISKRLIEKKNEVNALMKRLDTLRVLRIETDKERELRALKNKEAFEKKFGKL